jgi:hypothetical protein
MVLSCGETDDYPDAPGGLDNQAAPAQARELRNQTSPKENGLCGACAAEADQRKLTAMTIAYCALA